MDSHVSVGRYLSARLQQCGVGHLFGIPGDFSLTLLDELLADDQLTWVGSANELNAAYAADGYARAHRGLGALVTTFGVGELSALNGIAGAYAEDVPVVKITGIPTTEAVEQHRLLHHTLADGDFGRFVRAYREVTAAAVVVTAETAADDIDRVLAVALAESKPVYLAIPADVASARIPADQLARPVQVAPVDPEVCERFRRHLEEVLPATGDIAVLAGPRLHRRRLEDVVHELADLEGVRIASQPGSKAILDESHPASLGTYMGTITQDAATREAIDSAAPVVLAGVVLTDLLTGFFSHGFDVDGAIDLGINRARIGRRSYPGMGLASSIAVLTEVLRSRRGPRAVTAARPAPVETIADARGVLDQRAFWQRIQAWLPGESMVVADAGTAYYGALGLTMPDHSDLLGQPVWSSIGFTLPATLGACLSRPDRRPVLFIGDGSAQLTIQELGTLLRHGRSPVIMLLDNAGYTVERAIQSPQAAYQDVPAWDWTALPAAFAPEVPTLVRSVETLAELDAALIEAATAEGPVFLRIRFDRLDTPPILARLAEGLAAANATA